MTSNVLPPVAGESSDAQRLTETVTRLRRALRATVRTDHPWELLPMAQVELLQVLAEESPLRIRDIAERRNLATNTVSNLVGQMTTDGMVERATSTTDRRVAAVTLTPAGAEKLQSWIATNERQIGAALATLDEQDRAAVRAALPALERLADALALPSDA